MIEWLNQNLGTNGSEMLWYWRLLIVLGIVALSFLVDLLFAHLIIPAIKRLTSRTETQLDDILLSQKVCNAFSNILPPIVLSFALPFALNGTLEMIAGRLCNAYIIICVIRFLCVVVGAFYNLFVYTRGEKARSLKGLAQTLQIILTVLGIILVISTLLDKSPMILISGLGAMAAVMMLVFQDSIKGLVAGIQLSFNDMLAHGDWISMPSRNVDGVVTDITLTTVKVQNWDNTILTIPPYTLVTETFQNWKGMQQSTGRRLSRQICIDVNTVRFLDKASGRTNLQQYREELYKYLQQHPAINADMTLMVRQLKAGTEGIPVEIYAFTRTKVWEEYEAIQAQLVEYALAILPEYGLRAYQRGSDFRQNLSL